jgi:hypothetical protein
MLRFRKKIKYRVSNKLAAVSALLLLITSLTGASGALTEFTPNGQSSATGFSAAGDSDYDPQAQLQNPKPRKFKLSLMLFPAN